MRRWLPGILLATLLAAPASAATLVVRAEGIASNQGEIKVAVCSRSFDEAGCPRGQNRAPRGAIEEFVFDDLTPGRYAIAVLHDLNGNGEFDRTAIGLPTEPYGFSNDIGRFGPPRFRAALIDVAEGRTTVVIRVRPLLGGP